jgi:NADH dehydrogenase
MPARVFLTGGTGFVGSAVIDELLSRDCTISALARGKAPKQKDHLHLVHGDLSDAKLLESAIRGCDAVVHLVGIIRENPKQDITFHRIHTEGTRSIVDATMKAGVRRYLHMSALGTRAEAKSEYHRTKFLAEQVVRESDLDWTIFQPSLIHGDKGEFMQMAAKWARGKAAPFLFMPYFGSGLLGFSGAKKIQPIFVKDVARAFVDAIDNPKSFRQTYELAGPDQMTWPQMYRSIARAVVGKQRLTAPIPAWYAKLLTNLLPASLLPFNADQVEMSQEDSTCNLRHFVNDFGFAPQAFESSLQSYASSL